MRLPHNWTKWQKPAKNKIKKFVKLIDHTYAWNNLTNFEYVVQAITGNGSYLNLQSFAGKKLVNSLLLYLFSADFLEPSVRLPLSALEVVNSEVEAACSSTLHSEFGNSHYAMGLFPITF